MAELGIKAWGEERPEDGDIRDAPIRSVLYEFDRTNKALTPLAGLPAKIKIRQVHCFLRAKFIVFLEPTTPKTVRSQTIRV